MGFTVELSGCNGMNCFTGNSSIIMLTLHFSSQNTLSAPCSAACFRLCVRSASPTAEIQPGWRQVGDNPRGWVTSTELGVGTCVVMRRVCIGRTVCHKAVGKGAGKMKSLGSVSPSPGGCGGWGVVVFVNRHHVPGWWNLGREHTALLQRVRSFMRDYCFSSSR